MMQGGIMNEECDDQEEIQALLYQAHHLSYLEDIPFWTEIAASYGSPLLELGCGTGRVLVPLAEIGFQIFGLDINYQMLSVLKNQPTTHEGVGFHVFQADTAAFNLATEFSMVFMPCNTFSTFTEMKRHEILRVAGRHLRSGGIFVISLPNPALLKRLPHILGSEIEEVIIHPLTGYPVQVTNSWERSREALKVNWSYDHLFPDGKVMRYTINLIHYIVEVEQYENEFLMAGLPIKAVYGGFDFSEYHRHSDHLILIGEKNC
jgi:SAM-dependent methyltransferase